MDDRPALSAPPIQAVPATPGSNAGVASHPSTHTESPLPRPGRAKRPWKKDALTGLHGQRYLCHAIDESLRRCRSRELGGTLALLQLENFYEIRTWVGVSEADLLLADIAQLLKKALPRRVLLCRCHNYEFAALLLADASVNAGAITEKLKQALLNAVSPVLPPQLELKCGVGLAKLDANIPSWPVVFARARHNLRLAHRHGELPTQLSAIAPGVALKQLQAALVQPTLTLNFQAWVGFDEDSRPHFEVRCVLSSQPDRLPTVLLFETAARNALGERLDRRVIEQLIARLEGDANTDARLVINLSHNSVVSQPFLRWLEEKLNEATSIAPRLVFQIGETDALIAQHHLITFCELIERLGSTVSLSNFGCTPNPLRYLSLVPARYVKLDAGLLDKVDANAERLGSLQTLCRQLHGKGIAVVAPLLERSAVLPLLWQARIDYLQGYCLHPPSATMEYAFLKTQRLSFD